jgi:DNA-binding phage protein
MGALDRVVAERERRQPGFAALVEEEERRVRALDELVNVVVARLQELGWSRERLAQETGLNAAALRRLLTSESANPTFATLLAILTALGLRLELREEVTVDRMLTRH